MELTTACTDYFGSGWSGTTSSGNWTITYPSTWYYNTYPDKGQKALNILKAMRDKKLMHLKSIDEFIDAMNLIMKEL